MKKLILIPIFLLTILLFIATFVDINTPAKLPEGKNYLDSKNIYKEERFVYTDKPFLVKENTKYTFSISRDYVDGYPFEVIIELYEDERLINITSRDSWTMSFDIPSNTYYFSFTTPLKTNYIDLRFTDNGGDYENREELVNVQLEEGSTFTTYEPYVQSNLISNPIFLIIFFSLVFIVISGRVFIHYLPRKTVNKNKKSHK